MESSKSLGRITGVLLLVHLAGGLMLPYILMQPALAAPGFLENAAANAVRIRAAVLLLFMSGALTVAVALTALPVFRRYGERLALLLVVLSAANLALHAVENGTLLSMLSLSREYAQRGGAEAALFQGLGGVVGSARRWAHFTHLLVVLDSARFSSRGQATWGHSSRACLRLISQISSETSTHSSMSC